MADKDREQALETALSNIEKQFGKGSVMRLGDDTTQDVPAVSTGALSLDLALGIGGVPRGRVVELYGPESSGKCLTADTYVWSDHGLETIEELFARCGQATSTTSRVTEVSDRDVRLVNEDGELEPMAAVTHNGRRPVWRIRLDSGRTVTATARHPLRVMNERGRIVWRTVEDLEDGDVMVSALFGASEAVGAGDLSEDEAVLLGYLVAEGTLGEQNAGGFGFSNAHDPDVLEEYLQLVEHVLGVDRERVKTYADKDHWVHDTELRQRLHDEYGLGFVNAGAKTVPQRVRTGGPKIQRAFLSALYEGDGWIEKGPSIGLTTASESLAEQVQLLLYGLGIPASLRARHHDELDRDYHTVLVSPGAAARFLKLVGFRSARRAEQVERHLTPSAPSTQLEHVPHVADLVRDLRDALGGDRDLDSLYHDLTRDDLTTRAGGAIDASRARLQAIVAWADARHVPPRARDLVERLRTLAAAPLTFERIVDIEEAGTQPTFDVVVPRTHSFLANGLLSHNTTLALHILAEAQKAGGIAAFIDAEHALDPVYAEAIGIDVNELLVSQPDTGEQALEIMDMLVRSGAVDVVAIDSVAALTPRAEIEGEMGDTHVGLQARLMSQAMRKLAGSLKKSNTCALFINQIREKIGVMFGCMSWETEVTLADGSKEFIGKIVNQKMDVEVLSYDTETGKIVPRRITDWYDNGPTEKFLFIQVANSGPTGKSQTSFRCTPNHQVMTPTGWVEARELEVGDLVIRSVPHHLSDFQWEALLGTLMGDASLSPNTNGLAARLRWGHGEAQAEYADWKASLFANVDACRSTNDKDAVFYDVQPLPELAALREAVYVGGKKVLSYDYLKRLTPLSIALWYQDDGGFQIRSKGKQTRSGKITGRAEICVEAMERTSRQRLRDHLADTWGIEAKLTSRGGNAALIFPSAETEKLHALVAPFIHPSMDYKLLPHHRGRFAVEPQLGELRHEPLPLPVVNIEEQPPLIENRNHRYDIEIEGTHNYFVNGVMVHNSPETTPGGRALKFYSSVRLDIRRIETLKDGSDAVGNRCRVKVVKNKVAPPFRKGEFDIVYGEGISREGSLLDMGVEEGIIRKAGAWYSYDDEQLGQGRENARQFLKEHDDVAREIEKRIKEELGIAPLAAEGGETEDEEDDDGDEE